MRTLKCVAVNPISTATATATAHTTHDVIVAPCRPGASRFPTKTINPVRGYHRRYAVFTASRLVGLGGLRGPAGPGPPPGAQPVRTASPDNGPVTGLAGGAAYSSRLEVPRPSAARDSTIFTPAATPSTTGSPSSAVSAAASPLIPAQPSTITSQRSDSRAAAHAWPTAARAAGESRSRTGISQACTPAHRVAKP